jgi:RNA polymerase subunit RPABC4/transcription elongation factor Spt4
MGREFWHGQSRPCVSCGQLVRREQTNCPHCGQDLSEEMLGKMRQHAGPWDVFEHVRPFPGVSFERIVRQIHRGAIMETSIVRGPTTDFQWRFAGETRGLARFFGRCWKCHRGVALTDVRCPNCQAFQLAEEPQRWSADSRAASSEGPSPAPQSRSPRPAAASRMAPSPDWMALKAAVEASSREMHSEPPAARSAVLGAQRTWLVVAMAVLALAGLTALTQIRNRKLTQPPRPETVMPTPATPERNP